MKLLQLEETLEEFLQKNDSKTLSKKVFNDKYYPKYKVVKEFIYIHLSDGVCRMPFKEDIVFTSEIRLLTDDDVEFFKQIIDDYEDLINIGKYIVAEHKSAFKVIPAPITIEEFKEQVRKAYNDNGQFIFDQIEFYPNQSSYPAPDFEVIDSYIDSCFIHLKDGWVKVPLAENYTYGNWYYCSCTVLNKENIKEIEDKMKQSIERNYIEQYELKALKYMLNNIKNS